MARFYVMRIILQHEFAEQLSDRSDVMAIDKHQTLDTGKDIEIAINILRFFSRGIKKNDVKSCRAPLV